MTARARSGLQATRQPVRQSGTVQVTTVEVTTVQVTTVQVTTVRIAGGRLLKQPAGLARLARSRGLTGIPVSPRGPGRPRVAVLVIEGGITLETELRPGSGAGRPRLPGNPGGVRLGQIVLVGVLRIRGLRSGLPGRSRISARSVLAAGDLAAPGKLARPGHRPATSKLIRAGHLVAAVRLT